MSRSVTARFLPLSKDKDAKHQNWRDKYRQALKHKRSSGMHQSDVFGKIGLRMDLEFKPDTKSKIEWYWMDVISAKAGKRGHSPGLAIPDDTPGGVEDSSPQNLHQIIRETTKNLGGAVRRLTAWLQRRKSGGLGHWLKRPSHSVGVGVCWFLLCIKGVFPPPPAMYPMCVWCLILANGVLGAQEREEQWENVGTSTYHVWTDDHDDDSKTKLPIDFVKDIAKFKKLVITIEETLVASVTCLEKFTNLWNFSDGTASVIIFAITGAGAALFGLLCSLVGVFCEYFDPTGAWFSAFAGCLFWFAIAFRFHKPPEKRPPRDIPARVRKLNEMLACVPDEEELCHRFVSSRLQCFPDGSASVQVSLIAAEGLHFKRGFFGRASHSHCVCEIPGKPQSKFKTAALSGTDPKWDHVKEIVDYAPNDPISFTVMCNNAIIGKVVLRGEEYYPGGYENQRLLLAETPQGAASAIRVKIKVLTQDSDPCVDAGQGVNDKDATDVPFESANA